MQRTQKLESVGLLAGGIAHDFNNLLTGIIGNIHLAKLTSPSEKMTLLLDAIENASQRAQELTRQLLTFSKGGGPYQRNSLCYRNNRRCNHLCSPRVQYTLGD